MTRSYCPDNYLLWHFIAAFVTPKVFEAFALLQIAKYLKNMQFWKLYKQFLPQRLKFNWIGQTVTPHVNIFYDTIFPISVWLGFSCCFDYYKTCRKSYLGIDKKRGDKGSIQGQNIWPQFARSLKNFFTSQHLLIPVPPPQIFWLAKLVVCQFEIVWCK